MKSEYKIIALSILAGLLVWVTDAVSEYLFFYEGSFLELLILDVPPHEVSTRLIAIMIFILFGVILLRIITRRKQAEEVLRESEVKYRSLFDNMLDGFAYCEMLFDENNQPVDFVYLEVNDASEKLTGLRKQDILGKKATEAIPGIKEIHPELFNIYGKVALTGEPNSFEFYFEPLEIWLAISVYSPQKGYFVAIFENITERKSVEEKWRQYHLRLEEMVSERTAALKSTNEQFQQEIKERKRAEQALRELYRQEENLRSELEKQIQQRIEFTRVLVHELKTPLTPVLGASRLLADNLKEEPWLSLAVNINRGAHNLNSRIDELLDLAKGEIGTLKLDYDWVDPSKLLQDMLDYVSPEAEILEQILISDIPPSLPQVWVDQERLRQVILNLLNNALKFNPKGGKVTVKARQRKDNLIVEIKDTGHGINEQEQERLFQPYFRLERDRNRLSGLGLGLSLSKMLIDLHGGRIWVKSQKGKGSTFGFSVPVKVTGCAE